MLKIENNKVSKCTKTKDKANWIKSTRKNLRIQSTKGADISSQSDVGATPSGSKILTGNPGIQFLPPNPLRVEQKIQKLIQFRLTELAENLRPDNSKIKSQRGGLVIVFVGTLVKRPMNMCLAVRRKKQILYNQFTPIQWMAGCCSIIRDDNNY